MIRKILLIAPNFYSVYQNKVSRAMPVYPSLSLATLGAGLLIDGHQVKVCDLNVSSKQELFTILKKPFDFIGITFLTPSFPQAIELAVLIKKKQPKAILIAGGPHASVMPELTLKEGIFDIVVVGEGDQIIRKIVGPKKIIRNGIIRPKKLIGNLDNLPLPAWQLFNLAKYQSPLMVVRKSPVGMMETSRGCPYGCLYCNKSVFGQTFRAKSAPRVVMEMERMLKFGFKEIWIADDGFSTDLSRAKEICDLIIKKRLKIGWSLPNGIRADRIDQQLLLKLKQAGCYRVAFGVESGNQRILNGIKKDLTLDQLQRAFKMAKKANLETSAFVMFGLPGETEATMRQTIKFTKKLDPDYPKAAITVPLPGTPLFNRYVKEKRIISYCWLDYNQQTTNLVYRHERLAPEVIIKYYRRFYRELYWWPRSLLKRIRREFTKGRLFRDVYFGVKNLFTRW